MDEFVIVVFEDDDREVVVDGGVTGLTNRLFIVQTGFHTFSLAGDPDYGPSSQTVLIQHTRQDDPFVLAFVKRAQVRSLIARASAPERRDA